MPNYVSGQPELYVITTPFRLGEIRLEKGMEVLYDGQSITVPGYDAFKEVKFRGAIKTGWAVPPEQFDPDQRVRPISANIGIGPTEGGNPMDTRTNARRQPMRTSQVEAEERQVMDVRQHSTKTQQRNATNYRSAPPQRRTYQVENQEGEVVDRPLRTLAGQASKDQRTSLDYAGQAIREAQSIQVEPQDGITREEMLDRMTPSQREEYEDKVRIARSAFPVEETRTIRRTATSRQPKQAARQPQQQAAFDLGAEEEDLPDIADLPSDNVTVTEVEGMKFTQTNIVAPRPAPAPTVPKARLVPTAPKKGSPEDDQCRLIATAICADFPDNYRFDDSIHRKIGRLQLDYEDRPDIIRAVAAADTDPEVRSRLLKEFPSAFARARQEQT